MDGRVALAEEPLAIEVVTSMADHVGVDDTALPPLAESIDADVLYDHPVGLADTPIEVTYRYNGYGVTADGDRHVTIA